MKAVCRQCNTSFDATALGAPVCPKCGSTIADVAYEQPSVRWDGAQMLQSATSGTPRRVPITGSVVLQCTNGHEWSEPITSGLHRACPHGTTTDEQGASVPAQVDLLCQHCGAWYSVVGEVGRRTCPRCGSVMTCPRCLASAQEEVPRAVSCPTCGEPPIRADETPAVRFAGDVHKLIH